VLVVSATPIAEAGRRVARAVRETIAREGRARLAVPGGSAASALGEARFALASDGAWAKVSLTWVDERCVPFADEASNRGSAHRARFLDESAPPALELALYEDGEAPREACARADGALRARFDGALDVVLLGMGEDGHVASLFPGRAIPRGVRVAYVKDSPKPPPDRITLTREMLATAEVTVLLATGEGKRDALSRLVRGDAMLPALGLPGLVVVTDLDDIEQGERV
jgi:6-phosphogluconolactonase